GFGIGASEGKVIEQDENRERAKHHLEPETGPTQADERPGNALALGRGDCFSESPQHWRLPGFPSVSNGRAQLFCGWAGTSPGTCAGTGLLSSRNEFGK